MNEFWMNFHFIRPWILLLLIFPIFLYWKYYKKSFGGSSWENICDAQLLKFLLIKGSSSKRKTLINLAFIGSFFGLIGAAGPTWDKQEISKYISENPLMILLNVSSDMQDTDISPNRLNRAKYKIQDLLQELKSVQVGLVVYSSEPFLISPITQDIKLLENLLTEINFDIMPVNGNRMDKAILYAADKLSTGGYAKGHILIFTSDAGSEFQQTLNAAKKVKKSGYTVDIEVISLEKLEKLSLVAQAGGGKAVVLQGNDEDIRYFAQIINKQNGELKEIEEKRTIWFDKGYYLTFFCLLCVLYFFRPGVLCVLLISMTIPNIAQASFFLNSNQEGMKFFNAGNYEEAAKKFENTNWQGASLYKSGNYEEAYKAFSKGKNIDDVYNQGNALAKSGKIDEAIKKYEEVLEKNPSHEDAKFNLEYLKKYQQEQSQNSSGEEDNQDDKQEQQNNQSTSSQQNNDKNQNSENEGSQQSGAQNNLEEQEGENNKNDGQNQPNQEKEQSTSQNQQKAPPSGELEQGEENEKQQNYGAALQNKEDEPKYDEEAQARAQQYREIPEDVGGLLKAFIYKEYQKRKAEQ